MGKYLDNTPVSYPMFFWVIGGLCAFAIVLMGWGLVSWGEEKKITKSERKENATAIQAICIQQRVLETRYEAIAGQLETIDSTNTKILTVLEKLNKEKTHDESNRRGSTN